MAGKTRLLIIAGPTASSKSEIGIFLAGNLGGEIVNADSIQVYRHFDIGSAKPSPELQRQIPHHLIDILDPSEEFNAHVFSGLASAAVSGIAERGRLSVMVGGTGLYIRCFLYGLFPQDGERIRTARREWEQALEERGLPALYEELGKIDPESASRIHPNDRIRITRALEYFTAAGKPFSTAVRNNTFVTSPYDFLILVPRYSRDVLRRRIEERTAAIFRDGIVEEVRAILARGCGRDIKPLRSIGYREALKVADGVITVDEAIERTVKATKDYAKRQEIWFRKEKGVLFMDMDSGSRDDFLREAKKFLAY